MDRRRFQPWVSYYPSGIYLAGVAQHSNQLLDRLRLIHPYRQLFVLAHSMGGLLSRELILKRHESSASANIPLFISISSPWNGDESARLGVEHSPAVIDTWLDMAPDSSFLTKLFYVDAEQKKDRRVLPSTVKHHLLFGFNRNELIPGKSGDGTVTVASQLRPEAQSDAARIYGFDATQVGILENPDVSALLNAILLQAATR